MSIIQGCTAVLKLHTKGDHMLAQTLHTSHAHIMGPHPSTLDCWPGEVILTIHLRPFGCVVVDPVPVVLYVTLDCLLDYWDRIHTVHVPRPLCVCVFCIVNKSRWVSVRMLSQWTVEMSCCKIILSEYTGRQTTMAAMQTWNRATIAVSCVFQQFTARQWPPHNQQHLRNLALKTVRL
jgi:hypothetical protein